MFRKSAKLVAGLAAIAALALGGSAVADAASSGSTQSSTTQSTTPQGAPPAGKPAGQHVGAHGKTEQLLTGETATKVKDAALAKVPGGTIIRVETDVDTGSPYEAHVKKADGSQVVVYVNKAFAVTSVASFAPRG
jgi:uncharacterized membrane protein YkoI